MSAGLWAGMTPPAILRARPLESAEEILVCSYTADLAFFESTCLFSARQAMRARVTLVHDDMAGNPTSAVRHAGRAYTAVPVRCRNNREFHPKLLVVAGLDEAVVAIGSGNMTQSGWHYNGEIWATVAASAKDWPETFHVIADWLRRLPEVVYMDPFGASRVEAVAKLLKRHPAVAAGPRVVHNLDTALLDQLPVPEAAVDELVVASPFLDGGAEALHAVSRRFGAARTTCALTTGAKANAATLAAWARQPGRQVCRVSDGRHLHGKLVEWASGDSRTALVGSPNVTRAALLDTTTAGGNCELGLITDVGGSLAPQLDEAPLSEDELDDFVSDWDAEQPAVKGPRLLRVLAATETVTVWLTRSGDLAGSVLLMRGEEPGLPLAHGDTPDGGLVELTANVTVAPGTDCSVRLADGRVLGPVAATGRLQVQQRPGAGSPLDAGSLPRVLADPEQNRRLLELLAELAVLRPDGTGPDGFGGGATTAGSGGWRARGELLYGAALIAFALGGRVTGAGVSGGDPAADAPELADDPWEEADAGDPGIEEGDDESDPAALQSVARRIDRRCRDLHGWNMPAVLGLLRLYYFVLSDPSTWENGYWPDPLARMLARLAPDPAWGLETEEARQAAVVTGLALLDCAWQEGSSAYNEEDEEWPAVAQLGRAFHECRTLAAVDTDRIDLELVEEYAGMLSDRFGILMRPDSIADAIEWLALASPLAHRVESLDRDIAVATLTLSGARTVEARTSIDPWNVAMRVLDGCKDLTPIAVRVDAGNRWLGAVLLPDKRLLAQEQGGPVTRGWEWRIAVAPAAHLRARPPNPRHTWLGAAPDDVRELLSAHSLDATVLDPAHHCAFTR